jgi:heat-inducible transcriptional repressor
VLSPRQELILSKVVMTYQQTDAPVGSKLLSADPEVQAGPSTIRNELALLEEHGLLAHPHTSAGRVPTDAGFRYFVDRLLPTPVAGTMELDLVRREVDEAMRITTETLSQVTNLLAIVSAPPVDTATIRHIEIIPLQPQVLMTVVITSTGGVSKRMSTFHRPVDPGLVKWAGEYLNERLVGLGLGARMLHGRLVQPGMTQTEESFLAHLAPVFTELAVTSSDTLYVEGAARLLREHRFQDLSQINELMQMLEERMALLGLLRVALGHRDVTVRIGAENEAPALRSLALVAAGYGLPQRALGTVSLIGPVHMDYGKAIGTVRTAARQLSRFIADVYDEG